MVNIYNTMAALERVRKTIESIKNGSSATSAKMYFYLKDKERRLAKTYEAELKQFNAFKELNPSLKLK